MLKPLDTVEHSAIRFITGDGFMTHHCQLYQDVSWTSLTLRRVYGALFDKLPVYLRNLLIFRILNFSMLYPHAQNSLALNIPTVWTEEDSETLSTLLHLNGIIFGHSLSLDALIPFSHFRHILSDFMHSKCACTFWWYFFLFYDMHAYFI